ncbi:hypothetical protein JCM16303_001810 [Sporobolomyces ruberrimus]
MEGPISYSEQADAVETGEVEMGSVAPPTSREGQGQDASEKVTRPSETDTEGPAARHSFSSKELKLESDSSSLDEVIERIEIDNLPLELFYMIGEHLEPFDLLQLTRVNKRLRQIFTSKRDSHRIWKVAFDNVELPALDATDWDFITLASLVHDSPCCHACGSKSGTIAKDFRLGIFLHSTCDQEIFSHGHDILEDPGNFHPHTLSCLSGRYQHAHKESHQVFVSLQVEAMNSHLLALESEITRTRDRSVRKASREARDAFVAEKSKNDEGKLVEWEKAYQERMKKAEAARKALRVSQRKSEVRRRLVALGHLEIDIEMILNDGYVTWGQDVDDARWAEISTELLSDLQDIKSQREEQQLLEETKVHRCKIEFRRLRQMQTCTDVDRALFPTASEFQEIPTVKALLGTAITDSETTWITVLPAVLAEVAEVQRAKKLIWARSLASALSQIGHPLPADTTNALDRPGWSIGADADGRFSPDLFTLDDPATISDDQLDILLARFTSRAFYCRIDASNYFLGSISAIGALQKLDPSYGSLVRVCSLWMRILFHVFEATGMEDGPGEEATAKLEAMGPVFECRWRHCPKQPTHRMTFSQIFLHHTPSSQYSSTLMSEFWAKLRAWTATPTESMRAQTQIDTLVTTDQAHALDGSPDASELLNTGFEQVLPPSKKPKVQMEDPLNAKPSADAPSLPLDLWCIIGEDLEPRDLLCLTRLSKDLRQIFTSKRDSQRIWKVAFNNVDFPELVDTDWDLITLASFLHDTPRFSTSKEIDRDVSMLHPDTLLCVPSVRNATDRKSPFLYVTAQVMAMNAHLLQLDLATSGTRDRAARKTARETRDKFVAQQKKLVNARHRDGVKLEKWQRGYKERIEKREAAAEEAAETARLDQQANDIRHRLLTLGHLEEDVDGLAVRDLMAQDGSCSDHQMNALFDKLEAQLRDLKEAREVESQRVATARQAELQAIEAKLEAERCLNEAKLRSEEAERRENEVKREAIRFAEQRSEQQKFRIEQKRLEQLQACKTDLARETFPSEGDFQKLPSVNPLLSSLGNFEEFESNWAAALPVIQAEVAIARQSKKLVWARSIAAASEAIGRPLPPDTTDALKLSRWCLRDEPNQVTSLKVRRPFEKSNSTNSSPVSPLELAAVTAISKRKPSHKAGVSLSQDWMRILFHLLDATGIEDGPGEKAPVEFEALGPVFECKWALCSKQPSGFLTFSQLVVHVQLSTHARALNPFYASGQLQILPTDIVYDLSSITPDPWLWSGKN